jgi:hypothetical protein
MPATNLNQPSFNPTEDTRSSETATSVSVTSTASVIRAANATNASYSFYNVGPSDIFIAEGSSVTTSAYKVKIPAGYIWEPLPSEIRYAGDISAITASGTATVMVSTSTFN